MIINLNPHFDYCCICNVEVEDSKWGIPMYEGIPVPHDYTGEWGGFCACEECFKKYENDELEMW